MESNIEKFKDFPFLFKEEDMTFPDIEYKYFKIVRNLNILSENYLTSITL